MVALVKPDNQIAQPQKSNEWYTHARYIEAARLVMGGIDLDPASCELANQTVKAGRYYSKEDDGLSKEWHGRVWLNPPFGRIPNAPPMQRSTIAKWVEKALYHYRSGDVSQVILLLPIHASVTWFFDLIDYPICFTYRVWFYVPGGSPSRTRNKEKDTHRQGTIFVYLGPHEHKFIDIFSQFGRITKAIDTPRKEVAPIQLWEVK